MHELGHFVAAKSVGIHVNVFSIGFGRRVLGFKWRGTDYRLSLLPFGGYVQMAGADPFGYADAEEEPDDPATSFQNQAVWRRLTALAAGPAFNLLLPIGVFTALLMAGEPQAQAEKPTPAPATELRPPESFAAITDRDERALRDVGDEALEQLHVLHLGPGQGVRQRCQFTRKRLTHDGLRPRTDGPSLRIAWVGTFAAVW